MAYKNVIALRPFNKLQGKKVIQEINEKNVVLLLHLEHIKLYSIACFEVWGWERSHIYNYLENSASVSAHLKVRKFFVTQNQEDFMVIA